MSTRVRECPPLPHLSEFARDALCVMAAMALPSQLPRSASLLSFELGMRPGRVDRIFRLLARARLIVIDRGRTGGARLTAAPQATTLDVIYRAVRADGAMGGSRCPLVMELDQLVTGWLASHTLEELAGSMVSHTAMAHTA